MNMMDSKDGKGGMPNMARSVADERAPVYAEVLIESPLLRHVRFDLENDDFTDEEADAFFFV